ncbi:MAG TPA: rRNA adenine N-6-methyltransferase family protein [Silvibacterium sp.]|nr:rRNA adenine N-6-methyltransferase family protein [Silvibacterium sp.]
MATLEAHQRFFADLITMSAGVTDTRITSAFAKVPREHYLGPGPWKVFTGRGFVQTPSDDPAFLYQNLLFSLDEKRKINNGQPALHALCLAALDIKEGNVVVHIGAGTGYYTAILAELTGTSGSIFAYEIEESLAKRAAENLGALPNVTVIARSGAADPLPSCDVVYVNAGATAPLDIWLDALRPSGTTGLPAYS